MCKVSWMSGGGSGPRTHRESLRSRRLRPNKVLVAQGEIGRAVRGDVLVALHQFVQLQTHQARHCGSGGGDGGDDLPSDELAL